MGRVNDFDREEVSKASLYHQDSFGKKESFQCGKLFAFVLNPAVPNLKTCFFYFLLCNGSAQSN